MNPPTGTPPQYSVGVPPPSMSAPGHYVGVPLPSMSAPGQWSTGLCECDKDWSNCCLTCWCPCIPFGQIAEILDNGTTSCGVHGSLYTLLLLLTGYQCIYSCMYRSKMRQQYMLPEQPCNDCVVHWCCEVCSLCQMYRELKHRGFEPSLGWQGHLAKQNQGLMMPPVGPAGEMKR